MICNSFDRVRNDGVQITDDRVIHLWFIKLKQSDDRVQMTEYRVQSTEYRLKVKG